MHFLRPLTMRWNVFWVSKNQTAMLKWGNEDIENKWRRCCVSLLLLHHEWRLRWNDCSTTVGGTMTATEWGHVYTVWNISYVSPEKQVPLQIGDAPKYQSCSFFLNCSNWGGQRTDWHGLVLATLLRRKRSWEDMEGGWALHHMEYVRTFGTFFRMAPFLHRQLSWTTMVVWPWKQTLQEMRAEFLSEIWEEFLLEIWGEFPSKIWGETQ